MTQAISLLLYALLGAQGDPLLAGIEAYAKGDYASAERLLRGARTGGDERAQAFLAMTLAATSRCPEAEPALRKSAASANADIARLSSMALAQCLLASARTGEAANLVQELQSKYSADPDVLFLAARFHMRAWNDTIYQLYQRAPASFRVNQISGEILEIQGQFAEAATEYQKAIDKNPKALSLHFRRGRALLMSSHEPDVLSAARKEFELELALNPQDSIAHYQVAQILQIQKLPREAAARFELALRLKPDFPEALIALGKLRLEEKQYDTAIALFERAVRLAPQSEPAHYNLMMAFRNAGKMAEARREKAELDKLQKAPEGEFTEFLKKLGEKPPQE